MAEAIVVGIDSSTTATKAVAWTASGRCVAEQRRPMAMQEFGDGRYEQDAGVWWTVLAQTLRALFTEIDPARVAAISIANQRETIVPCDTQMHPVRPAMLWLDERARDHVGPFNEALGAERLHALSGKPADITPAVYRLAWMRDHEPALYAASRYFMEPHGYLVHALTGQVATSWASADPLGVFDMQRKVYASAILAPLGLTAARFATAHPPGVVLGHVTDAAASATGLPRGLPVVSGAGDGQAAGLGANVMRPGRAYLNLGTAFVSGLYGREYRADRAFRTMISGCGQGYIYEYCLRSGTFLLDWLVRTLLRLDPVADPGVYDRLEREAAAVPPGADGLLLLPYWLGVMPPYWDMHARGALVGLSPQHGQGHLYRALLEGIAFEHAHATALAEAAGGPAVTEFIAIGGGARSDLWCQIFADLFARPVLRSSTVECSSLGAGMAAAVGAGWFADFDAAAEAMSGEITRVFRPRPDAAARYRALMPVYSAIYPNLRPLFAALSATSAAQEPVAL